MTGTRQGARPGGTGFSKVASDFLDLRAPPHCVAELDVTYERGFSKLEMWAKTLASKWDRCGFCQLPWRQYTSVEAVQQFVEGVQFQQLSAAQQEHLAPAKDFRKFDQKSACSRSA